MSEEIFRTYDQLVIINNELKAKNERLAVMAMGHERTKAELEAAQDRIEELEFSLLKKHWSCCSDGSCDIDCAGWPDAKSLAEEYCRHKIQSLEAEIERIRRHDSLPIPCHTKECEHLKSLEAQLKLKQDDWLEVCKEYEALEARNRELDEQVTLGTRIMDKEAADLIKAEKECDNWKFEYENACKFANQYEAERDRLKQEKLSLESSLDRCREALENCRDNDKTEYGYRGNSPEKIVKNINGYWPIDGGRWNTPKEIAEKALSSIDPKADPAPDKEKP